MANARSQSVERPQTDQSESRSTTRRGDIYFPRFGGDLFSLSPFALLREMTDFMDRSWATSPSSSKAGETSMWAPAIEVRHKDNNLVVSADLPGIDQNDLKIEVDKDLLVLSGERKSEHSEQHQGWQRCEKMYGNFYRAIPLPEGANAEQAKADFRNGVLEITIPVQEAKATRRQIPIQGGSQKTSS